MGEVQGERLRAERESGLAVIHARDGSAIEKLMGFADGPATFYQPRRRRRSGLAREPLAAASGDLALA